MEKILVLCDDVWHPAEVIERGMNALPENPYSFDFVCDARDILTPEFIAGYRLIICCKSNNITAANAEPWFEEGVTEVNPDEFREYLKKGGNMMIIHSGTAYWDAMFPHRGEERFQRPNDDYEELVGCVFEGHPPRCPVTIHVLDKNHPVTDGVKDFTERDEHYQIAHLAKDIHPLLESSSESGSMMTAGYTRRIGKGKMLVLTPGHNLNVWINSEFQKLLLNGMKWCLSDE